MASLADIFVAGNSATKFVALLDSSTFDQLVRFHVGNKLTHLNCRYLERLCVHTPMFSRRKLPLQVGFPFSGAQI